MGCDIHAWLEIFENGKWACCGETELWRHYDIFGMLANVRNGWGFAGCETGDGFIPISKPKGIPTDASPEYLKEVEDWDCDGHHHSYLTLAEIQKYLVEYGNNVTCKKGEVGINEYADYKKDGKPRAWCGGSIGENFKYISNKQMDVLVTSPPDDGYEYRTTVRWGVTYKEIIEKSGLAGVIKNMEVMARSLSPENVRIVFFFDN